VLGVDSFGVLEFANSLLAYLLLVADAGVEIWATREAAQTQDVRALVARVLPVRLFTAAASFLLLLGALPFLPPFPGLRALLVLFGLSVFAQAANLKWALMGQQRMSLVAAGLVITQIVFALSVFVFVHGPSDIMGVPVLRLLSDAAAAAYFAVRFVRHYGRVGFRPLDAGSVLRPALVIGAANAMGLLNYNFDSILLGYLKGQEAVAWYGAAYKPVTIALAVPLTYFLGLFPVLARLFAESRDEFIALVNRSFRLCAIFALPLGVGGTCLAPPVIQLLFGKAYENSVLPLRILVWSAVFVILRGSYRHSLNATGHQQLDLRCAVTSAALNVALNVALIPPFGLAGAAAATVVADAVWLTMACWYFGRSVISVNPLPFLLRPAAAAALMGALLWLTPQIPWVARAAIAGLAYFALLFVLGESEVRRWLSLRRNTLAA